MLFDRNQAPSGYILFKIEPKLLSFYFIGRIANVKS